MTVVPTAPSSYQRPMMALESISYSEISPPLLAMLRPFPLLHQQKSATPFLPSILACDIHCVVLESRMLTTPPPLRLEPLSAMYRPQGDGLRYSMAFWVSSCP